MALATLYAQVPNPTQQQPASAPVNTGQPMPVFTVTVVSRTVTAINYHHRSGTTALYTHVTLAGMRQVVSPLDRLPPPRGPSTSH